MELTGKGGGTGSCWGVVGSRISYQKELRVGTGGRSQQFQELLQRKAEDY